MKLSLVQIQDPRVEDTGHGIEWSPRLRVWTVGKDADRPVFGTWFRLIQTLMVWEMSMMTGTITGQVLHRRVHPETLLM
jgi:hypothetical protein